MIGIINMVLQIVILAAVAFSFWYRSAAMRLAIEIQQTLITRYAALDARLTDLEERLLR